MPSPPPLLVATQDQDLALVRPNDPPTTQLIRQAGFGGGYAWPVWSPDRSRALVSHGWRESQGEPHLDLLSLTIPAGAEEGVRFSNAEGHRDPIASGVMHYAHWSPDGRRALVVARADGGLGLSLLSDGNAAPGATAEPGAAWTADHLITAAPMFSAWSPDGTRIAVHAGAQLLLFDATGDSKPRRVLADQPRFRTPAWSADGSALYYAAPGAGGHDLLWRSDPDSGERRVVTELAGITAILAAPVGPNLALLTLGPGGLGGHDLRLLDPTHSPPQPVEPQPVETHPVEHGDVLGAFWSPDGAALFVVTRAGADTDFRLRRYDLAAGRSRDLARFRPSPAYSAYLAFFDQYALSHRLVSADGAWLSLGGVVAGNGAGAHPFALQHGCYILPSDGSAAPRRIANGEIAFFPPTQGPVG